jgi:hypothetical protein
MVIFWLFKQKKSPCQKTLPQTQKNNKKITIMSENTSTDPEKYPKNHHNVRKHFQTLKNTPKITIMSKNTSMDPEKKITIMSENTSRH